MQKDTRKNRGHPLGRKLLCIILAAGMLFTSAISDTAYANENVEHPPETIEQTENINNENSEPEQDTESDEIVQDESNYQDIQTQNVQVGEMKATMIMKLWQHQADRQYTQSFMKQVNCISNMEIQ